MEATLDYSRRPRSKPAGKGFPWRLLVFVAVIAIPFAWCAYVIFFQKMAVKHGDYYFVDLKAMGNFPFDATRDGRDAIPKDALALDGKKVKFDGEMFAPDAASDGVKQFQLVYSIVQCCMGGPPKVQERVFAFVREDKQVPNYSGRQVTVTGTLHVKPTKSNGEVVSVFSMDVDSVVER
jgi:hypothetical protein